MFSLFGASMNTPREKQLLEALREIVRLFESNRPMSEVLNAAKRVALKAIKGETTER